MRLAIAALFFFLAATASAEATRIKDITDLKGIRVNQVVGYGLVVGLNGTGDTLRNSPFTQQSVQAMLDRMGVNIRGSQYEPRTRNVAAVMVTAELPPFASKGARFDVTVSSIGDAKSLAGGALVLTPPRRRRSKNLRGGAGSGYDFRIFGEGRRRIDHLRNSNTRTNSERRHRRARCTRCVRREHAARVRAPQSGLCERRFASWTSSTNLPKTISACRSLALGIGKAS